MKPFWPILLCWLAFSAMLPAQNLIFPTQTFDDATVFGSNPSAGDWLAQGATRFAADGTADDPDIDPFWDERERIQSTSLGGAVVLFDDEATLRSPLLNFEGEAAVFLSFHQYFRTLDSDAEVIVSQDGQPLRTFQVNERLRPNVETSSGDTLILDLSFVAGLDNIQVEFSWARGSYFWLIDDVSFYDAYPYPPTNPTSFGQYLATNGYPYEVDTAGWAMVPYQLVVQFDPLTSDGRKEEIRQEVGARKLSDCVCGKLELWEIDGSTYFDEDGANPAGGTIDILNNKLKTGSTAEADAVDFNYYNGVKLDTSALQPVTTPLTPADLASIPASDPTATRIAIIDTGIDYNHPDPTLQKYLRLKPDALDSNGEDDDANCYGDDPLGWNFADSINNVFDNNSHGTHVAGILADYLDRYSTSPECTYEFVTYKTHDQNGIATLYNVACATYQAIEDSVSLINDSWGFFGDSSIVLRNAVDSAALNDILIISAAGNDSLDLDTLQQYPACYSAPNIITVSVVDSILNREGFVQLLRPEFANFSENWVDVLAPGDSVLSTVPRWFTFPSSCPAGVNPDPGYNCKSGTSMAAPVVTAVAALLRCCADVSSPDRPGFVGVFDQLKEWATADGNFTNVADEGRRAAFGDATEPLCVVVAVAEPAFLADALRVYPNPAADRLHILAEAELGEATLRLFDAQGQLLREQLTGRWYPGQVLTYDLAGLPAGLYWLQLQGEDYFWTGKLIKI